MDFALTAEQREIQALTREFAEAEIAPNAARWDRDHGFPRELLARLGELGLMGVCVPEEHGGYLGQNCTRCARRAGQSAWEVSRGHAGRRLTCEL